MNINSYCVIVTEYDRALFWSRPQNLDNALKLYKQKADEYIPDREGPIQISGAFMMYSDKWIEEQLRTRQDMMDRIFSRCFWFDLSIKKYNTQVQLIHSARA